MQIQIDAKQLRSLRHIAPKNDVRYYLNGVLVQCDNRGKYYVATDGHRLACYFDQWAEGEEPCDVEIIIPGDVIRAMKVSRHLPYCLLSTDDGTQWKLATLNGAALVFTPIDGKFPDWQRIIPTETSGEPGAFDLDYLASFNDVIREVSHINYSCALHANGPDSPAFVSHPSCPNFIGLLQAMSGPATSEKFKRPDWLDTQPQPATKAVSEPVASNDSEPLAA